MNETKEAVIEQQKYFQKILDCIHDRIYVTDSTGKIMIINQAVERDCDEKHKKDDLIGKNMRELVKEGFMKESLTLKVLEEGKAQGCIYHEPEGFDLLGWGTPYIENGEIQFVVCTEWDLDQLNTMKHFIEGKESQNRINDYPYIYSCIKNSSPGNIIANSNVMKKLLNTASMVARSDTTVLIHGETGTGKEMIMRYIHSKGSRTGTPLIEVNCGAIPENLLESEFFGYVKGAFTGADQKGKAGIFELANHGTIFLDEIDSLSLNAQTKLLRVLQEKTVIRVGGYVSTPLDVKVIAATNADLQDLVTKKRFREDLYYRLNVFPLYIPPLRERPEDIPELVRHFTKLYSSKYNTEKIISSKNMDLFLQYPWYGNVRELQNLIERAFLLTREDRISRKMLVQLLALPDSNTIPLYEEELQLPTNLHYQVEEFEKNLILSYLPQYKNSRQFAELLGIEKSTINRKLKKYNITIPR